ncbi:MAG: DNA repair protein RecO [Alphaproteobacteria bacterium]
MQWKDEGIVLRLRATGEHARVLSLFTATHGRHLGVVHGRSKNRLEIGTVVDASWRARREDQMGHYTCETQRGEGQKILALLGSALCLYGLTSLCELLDHALSEREDHTRFYRQTVAMIQHIGQENWLQEYVHWEVALLGELGFGLDLTACAVTGVTEGLCYVSPKTGRAVSSEPARPYRSKLLPLPAFLTVKKLDGDGLNAEESCASKEILEGLHLAGHFLLQHAFHGVAWKIPDARTRLIKKIEEES